MMKELGTSEVNDFLNCNPVTKKIFIGTFPSDHNLPLPSWYPYALVYNTDPGHMPGSHWVAVYVETPENVDYFDSFGMPPSGEIARWLSKFPKVRRLNFPVQPDLSILCGYYCLFFIYFRCLGNTFGTVVIKFSRSNRVYNDRMIVSWFKKFVR